MSRRRTRHPLAADLSEMLSYCRPMTSATTTEFCRRYLEPLPGAYMDQWGNWHVSVGDAPRVLWSTHTDTVHWTGGRQKVTVRHGLAELPLSSESRCLGADDTAGVWLASELIRRQIPGRYIFHHGEERGGIGSSALARYHPDWLAECQIAIALDRAGYTDVITHQGGERTASDAFADALAARLGMDYAASDTGIYTDTAEYRDVIAECTNISVGYFHAHTPAECVDLDHLWRLADRLSEIDYDALPVVRAPGEDDPDTPDGDDWYDYWRRRADRLPHWALWSEKDDDKTNGEYLSEDTQTLVREYFRDRLGVTRTDDDTDQ